MYKYVYYIVIMIVCYYLCWKCRNKTKLKLKEEMIEYIKSGAVSRFIQWIDSDLNTFTFKFNYI